MSAPVISNIVYVFDFVDDFSDAVFQGYPGGDDGLKTEITEAVVKLQQVLRMFKIGKMYVRVLYNGVTFKVGLMTSP